MNKKLLPYANYLLDNNPSPFCDYILCKELLKSDEKEIRESYEWAKRFKLYTEICDEQFSDGSWSDFYPMDTSVEVRKKHKNTKRSTLRRLRDLSLDNNDDTVAKTIDFCKRYINSNPNLHKTHILHEMYSTIYGFNPNDELVSHIKEERTVNIDKQRAYLIYEWDHGPFNICKLSDLILPENDTFVFWMCGLENLKDYSLFGEFMAEETSPFLYSLCERLVDPYDNIPICVNRYYGKVGQYSETWNKHEVKKKDLLLRIIRILNMCEK